MSHAAHQPDTSQSIGSFTFDCGVTVPDARFTFALSHPDGASDGLVIICPSLTGTPAILQHWWADVGPEAARTQYSTLYAHGFAPETVTSLDRGSAPTIRDLARGIVSLARSLGLPPATFVTGGSLGGMLALEVGIVSGSATHALVIAAPAVQTAWSAGWNRIQLQAMELGGDVQGFALARAVGMMTYRTEVEFETRFGVDAVAGDGRSMQSYLAHHGQRIVQRFDAREYERRVRAMDSHDVGRGRGGWRAALQPHAERLTAVGIDGDALYSSDIVRAWADAVGASFERMSSIHGHDAFLLERPQMRAVIERAFTRAVQAQVTPSVRR